MKYSFNLKQKVKVKDNISKVHWKYQIANFTQNSRDVKSVFICKQKVEYVKTVKETKHSWHKTEEESYVSTT